MTNEEIKEIVNAYVKKYGKTNKNRIDDFIDENYSNCTDEVKEVIRKAIRQRINRNLNQGIER